MDGWHCEDATPRQHAHHFESHATGVEKGRECNYLEALTLPEKDTGQRNMQQVQASHHAVGAACDVDEGREGDKINDDLEPDVGFDEPAIGGSI